MLLPVAFAVIDEVADVAPLEVLHLAVVPLHCDARFFFKVRFQRDLHADRCVRIVIAACVDDLNVFVFG